MKMKQNAICFLVALFFFNFVLGCARQGPTESKANEKEIPPEILVEVYDSLEQLEDLKSPAWDQAIVKACEFHEYIWSPLGERLEFLSESIVVKAGEREPLKEREKRLDFSKRYQDLRKSLAKIVRLRPDDAGLRLLIQHLDEDLPEGLNVLKLKSSEDFGFDRRAWTRWFIAQRLSVGTVDTQEAITSFVRSSPEDQIKILRYWISICGDLQIKSVVEKQRTVSQGIATTAKLKSRDLEVLRLQALAVFLEALQSSNTANLAILGLIQLGDLAHNALIDFVEKEGQADDRQRAITILGHSQSLPVAKKLIGWAQDSQLRSAALQSLGNLELSDESNQSLVAQVEALLKLDLSDEDALRVLAALVLLGEVERFPLILEYCPESVASKSYIFSRNVKDSGWLQVRRIARKTFDRWNKKRSSRFSSWKKSTFDSGDRFAEGSYSPDAEFKKYAIKNNLNFTHENWLSWWRKKLLRM